MRFLWFANARDSMKESRSHARQARRFFRENARLITRIENELEDAAAIMPSNIPDAHVRQFEAHIDVIKRQAQETREHLKHLERNVRILEEQLEQARQRARQQASSRRG